MNDGYKEVTFGPYEIKLPEYWGVSQLKNIAKEGNKTFVDGDWVESKDMVEDGEYQLVQLGNIGVGRFKGKCNKYVSNEFFNNNNCTLVEEGNLLISRMSSPVLRTIVFPEFDKKSITAVDIVIVKVDHKKWDRCYVKYLLNSQLYKNLGETYATGSTRLRISRKQMEKINIPLPPLPEQKKIATILSTVDKTIKKTTTIIDKTKRLKKGLMQRLLTKGIGHEEFKEVRINGIKQNIPINWKVKTIGECTYLNKNSINNKLESNDTIEYIDISSIEETGVISTTSKYILKDAPSRAKRVVNKGDIIISTVRPYLKAFALIQRQKDNLVCSTGYAVLTPKDMITSEYMFYIVCQDNFVNYLISLMRGTNYPAVNNNDVKTSDIPLPPLSEQKQIASILSSVDNKIQKEQEYKEQLQQLKKGLMQQLLTGKKRVQNV